MTLIQVGLYEQTCEQQIPCPGMLQYAPIKSGGCSGLDELLVLWTVPIFIVCVTQCLRAHGYKI